MIARTLRLTVMLIRPPVALVLMLFAALGLAQAGRANAFDPLFTTVLVIVLGVLIHAEALNDLSDEAIDRVNLNGARGRPLVSGDATRRQLLWLGNTAAALALIAAWTVNWRVGLVVVAGLCFNVAYSVRPVRIADRGAAAPLLLPLGYVVLPYLVGALSVQPALGRQQLLFLVGLYVTFIGRIILKDFRDVRGDAMFGKRTFLLRHGKGMTCLVSAAAWVAGAILVLASAAPDVMLVVAVAAFVGCALRGLGQLATAEGYVAEQVIIGAIAQAGRGMGIVLLAHLTMQQLAWTAAASGAVIAVLALVSVGMYLATLAERDRVLAIQPY